MDVLLLLLLPIITYYYYYYYYYLLLLFLIWLPDRNHVALIPHIYNNLNTSAITIQRILERIGEHFEKKNPKGDQKKM